MLKIGEYEKAKAEAKAEIIKPKLAKPSKLPKRRDESRLKTEVMLRPAISHPRATAQQPAEAKAEAKVFKFYIYM